jgi:hypothetical protein
LFCPGFDDCQYGAVLSSRCIIVMLLVPFAKMTSYSYAVSVAPGCAGMSLIFMYAQIRSGVERNVTDRMSSPSTDLPVGSGCGGCEAIGW